MAPGHGYARTCEAIPRRHEEAARIVGLPTGGPCGTHRTRARPRPSGAGTVRRRGTRPPPGHQDRRTARRAIRPARASGAGPDAARVLDLGRAARPVPRLGTGLWHSRRRRARRRAAVGGHRARRLVRAAPSPAAGWAGARDIAGRRHHAVRRLAAGQGDRAVRERQGAVGRRAGARHRRRLPWRAPGAATRRWRQPRRADRPPRRPGLARPLPAERTARRGAHPAPARLPEPADAALG